MYASSLAPMARAQGPEQGPEQGPDDMALAAARQLGSQGIDLYEAGDFAAASERLERAYAVIQAPTLGIWSGRALQQLGKLVEALQRYRDVTLVALGPDDPAVFHSAVAEARVAYDALSPYVPQVTIHLVNGDAEDTIVTIDGVTLAPTLIGAAVPIDPGTHLLSARSGEREAEASVELVVGELREVTLVLPRELPIVEAPPEPAREVLPPPPPTREPPSVMPWVLVGVGGAVASAGGVLLVLSLSAKADVESAKEGTRWSTLRDDYARVSTYSTLGFVGIGVGVATLATGITWKLLEGDRRTSVDVALGPGTLTLRGAL
jgi:hypothetical protein